MVAEDCGGAVADVLEVGVGGQGAELKRRLVKIEVDGLLRAASCSETHRG